MIVFDTHFNKNESVKIIAATIAYTISLSNIFLCLHIKYDNAIQFLAAQFTLNSQIYASELTLHTYKKHKIKFIRVAHRET